MNNTSQELSVYADWRSGANHFQATGLSLILYYDDIQVVNPVGNKTKHNKLGVFYFTLGNLPFRSRKRHIYLVALLRSSYLKGDYRSKVFDSLVTDLKILEDVGVPVEHDGQIIYVKGSVQLFIADNLAAHSIGGFLESFSNVQKVSRYCHCSSASIQTCFSVGDCIVRTAQDYDESIKELKLCGFDSKVSARTGIKSECAFNELKSFHIISCSPPDIAHDLYEGVIPKVLSAVLTELVKKKVLTVADINKAITSFPYKSRDKCNPPQPLVWCGGEIRSNQTAKESYNLLRLLPIILGYKVQADEVAWEILIAFVEVVRFIVSPDFTDAELDQLQSDIESWLFNYFRHFEHLRVTPKFHYLLHYPQQIRKHGALVEITTLRFESKNGHLKTFCKTTKNFRDICKTAAKKHQQWLSLKITRQDFFSWQTKFEPDLDKALQEKENLTGEKLSYRVTMKGTEYVRDDVLAFCKDHEIHFAKILAVHAPEGGDCKFQCRMYEDCRYDRHVAAYAVKESSNLVTLRHKDLADHHPLVIYGGRYVVEHHLLARLRERH